MRPKVDKLSVQHWTLNNFTLSLWWSTVTFQVFVNQLFFNQLFGRSAVISLALCWSDVCSFKKGFIRGWSWSEASSFTCPVRKTSFEAGAGLKHFVLQILWESLHLRLDLVWSVLLYKSFRKGFIWSWSWFEASCFTDPLRKASFEAGSGLKFFPSQILKEMLHLRLELVCSIFFYKSFKKVFIWGWSWFEASCLTNPLRKSSFEAGSGLKHLALRIL